MAAKLVRGAYMSEERRRAHSHNYPDPINDSYELTNQMYHSIIDFVLPVIATDNMSIMVATHNEDTIKYVKAGKLKQ